jgi:hypothetical protein
MCKMKKIYKVVTSAALVMAVMASLVVALAGEVPFGAAGAAMDESFTIEEMLIYAIQDEYMAQGEYEAIMEEYGVQRPFSNIIKAEERHISMLLPLLEKYDVEVPADDTADRVVIPASIAEGYKAGVDAEIKNIEMYESFLEEDLPDDVKAAFERLKSASEKHLSAFERFTDRSEGLNNVRTDENRRNGQAGFQSNARSIYGQRNLNSWSGNR